MRHITGRLNKCWYDLTLRKRLLLLLTIVTLILIYCFLPTDFLNSHTSDSAGITVGVCEMQSSCKIRVYYRCHPSWWLYFLLIPDRNQRVPKIVATLVSCILSGCSEQVYTFPCRNSGQCPGSIFSDLHLRQTCQEYENSRQKATSELVDKCGSVLTPQLISSTKVRRNIDDNTQFKVPNTVHYVSLGSWEFSFLNYLSFKSADSHIKPEAIYIHGDALPYGEWWNRMLADVPNVYYVKRMRPLVIQGRRVKWLEHSSDVMRLQTLLGTSL